MRVLLEGIESELCELLVVVIRQGAGIPQLVGAPLSTPKGHTVPVQFSDRTAAQPLLTGV